MNLVMLLSLGLMSQTMQFRNDAREDVSVRVFCFSHRGMANNNRAIQLRPGVTGSITLDHTGNYQVIAQTRNGQIDRNNRTMRQGELDRMVVTAYASTPATPPGKRRAYKPAPPKI